MKTTVLILLYTFLIGNNFFFFLEYNIIKTRYQNNLNLVKTIKFILFSMNSNSWEDDKTNVVNFELKTLCGVRSCTKDIVTHKNRFMAKNNKLSNKRSSQGVSETLMDLVYIS